MRLLKSENYRSSVQYTSSDLTRLPVTCRSLAWVTCTLCPGNIMQTASAVLGRGTCTVPVYRYGYRYLVGPPLADSDWATAAGKNL